MGAAAPKGKQLPRLPRSVSHRSRPRRCGGLGSLSAGLRLWTRAPRFDPARDLIDPILPTATYIQVDRFRGRTAVGRPRRRTSKEERTREAAADDVVAYRYAYVDTQRASAAPAPTTTEPHPTPGITAAEGWASSTRCGTGRSGKWPGSLDPYPHNASNHPDHGGRGPRGPTIPSHPTPKS